MNLPKNIYMVGIGGIGMSALAQYLQGQGRLIEGSDRDESPVVTMLVQKGIAVFVGDGESHMPTSTELLVYSDAIPSSNFERAEAQEKGIPQLSYFEVLGEISRGVRTIAVAGTHGKTTTTGMLASILSAAGEEPTAIVGSIVRDFGSNFLPGRSDLFVIEACEYRDHLLKLSPEILIITNIELDHTDYFPDLAVLQQTFRTAIERVPAHGFIVTNPGDPKIAPLLENVSANIVDYREASIPEIGLIGEFNQMNAKAAATAAQIAFPSLKAGSIDRALGSFQGSWRRFEYRGETPTGAQVYDDYAHHPTAIAKTIEAARIKFPGRRVVIAFHPHLFSRTKSFLDDFAAAIATADLALIAPIYAAREVPDPEISHHLLAEKVCALGGIAIALDSFDDIRDRLLQEDGNALIITMGAGDIYKVAEQIAD